MTGIDRCIGSPFKYLRTEQGYKFLYSSKALCDFVGIHNKKFILIECKEVSGDKFDSKRLKENQIKNKLVN